MGKWMSKRSVRTKDSTQWQERMSCWRKGRHGSAPAVFCWERKGPCHTHTPHPSAVAWPQHLGRGRALRSESKPGVATIREHSTEFTAVRIALCPVSVVVTKISTCENPQDCTPKKMIYYMQSFKYMFKKQNPKSPKPVRPLFLNVELLYSK